MNEEVDNALVADEEQLHLLLGSRASGRMKGMPNFRAKEDLQLAQAYATSESGIL